MKCGRNMKCPCGSGKKFKACHMPGAKEGAPFVTCAPDAEFTLFKKEWDGTCFDKATLEDLGKGMLAYVVNFMQMHGAMSGTPPSRIFVKLNAKYDGGLGLPTESDDLAKGVPSNEENGPA